MNKMISRCDGLDAIFFCQVQMCILQTIYSTCSYKIRVVLYFALLPKNLSCCIFPFVYDIKY